MLTDRAGAVTAPTPARRSIARRMKQERGIMKRLFKVLFFACGSIGLLLNLSFVVVSFTRDVAIETSAVETALELLWIGGCTFFGLGALILEDE